MGSTFRKGLICISSALLLANVGVADTSIDLKIPAPLGGVKSVKTYNQDSALKEMSIYDEHKRLVEHASFTSDGSIIEKDQYRYYSNGVKKEHQNWSGKNHTVFTYKENGTVKEITFPKRDPNWSLPIVRTIYQYKEADRLAENVSYAENGDEWERTEYAYKGSRLDQETTSRANGRTYTKSYEYSPSGRVKRIVYKNNGLLSAIWSFEYDKQGNKRVWIEERFYKGQPRGITTHRFDKKGNKIERNDGHEKRIYEYNSFGSLKREKIYTKGNRLSYQYIFSYDDKGNLVGWQEYFGKKSSLKGALNKRIKFDYIYDESGNWIERNEFYWDFDKKKFYGSESLHRRIVYW